MIPHPGVDVAGVFTPWTGKSPDYKLVVDFFAGGGGASKGIEMALGRSPDIAVNHDEEAIALHRANHPNTVHLQTDVWSVMPEMVRLIGNRRVGLFHASPDCKHFSKAKGGKPVKRQIRDLAWVIPQFCRRFRPEVVTLENVEEFRGWGPLVQKVALDGTLMVDDDGRPLMVPCKKRQGHTFKQWVSALERLGYRVEWKELRASDHGAPTIRKRLFVVGRCDGKPIVFPEPTHGDPSRPKFQGMKLKKWRTAAEIIDWSRPCHSIFMEKDEARKVGVKRPLADKTMARIAKGVFRFVINNPTPFIVNLTHHGGDRNESLDEPMRTITGAHRGEKAVVVPSITKFNTGSTGSKIDEPLPTVTANSFIKRPGGAAPIGLVEATVVGPFLAGVGGRMGQTESRTVGAPAQTLTAKADTVLVAAHVLKQNHGDKPASAADEPLHTIVAGGQTQAIVETRMVAPTLIQTGYGERRGQEPRVPGLDKPLGTAVAGGVKHAVVEAAIAPLVSTYYGDGEGDNVRAASLEEPLRTQTTENRHAVVAPVLVRTAHGDVDKNGKRRGRGDHSADEPLPTQTTSPDYAVVAPIIGRDGVGERTTRVAAFLAQHNLGVVGHDVRKPVSTISTKGAQQAVVAAGLMNMRGTAEDQQMPRSIDVPAATISAQGGHQAPVAAFLSKYQADEKEADIAPPEEIVTVEIDGEPWVITDIGMRMLTPRELFSAQGFRPDYIIDRGLFIEGGKQVWRKLTSTASVRMVGNSVSPEVEYALIKSNCRHLLPAPARRVA